LRINQKLKDVVVPPVRLLSLFFLLLIAIVTALNVPTFHASDDFHHLHEGEALSATSGYEAGLVPYRDILPVHGVIQDIFRIKLGFFLFGEGIGSARTVESVAKLIAYALFIWLIYKTLNRNTWASVAIFLFLNFSNKLFFLPPIIITARDIPFLLFLLAIPRAPSLLKASNSAQRLLPLYLSACIVFGGLYSIDRGIYLVLIALFVIGVVPIVGKWDKKAWLQWMTFWIIGLATAGIFFVSVIGDGFSSLWNYLIFSVTEKNFLDGLGFSALFAVFFFLFLRSSTALSHDCALSDGRRILVSERVFYCCFVAHRAFSYRKHPG
jgi:hypothetical protein